MLDEFKKIIDKADAEEDFVEGLCYLIKESGLSYQSLMGETLEVKKINENKWEIKREGMPLWVLMRLFKFIQKVKKIEEADMRKMKMKGRRR